METTTKKEQELVTPVEQPVEGEAIATDLEQAVIADKDMELDESALPDPANLSDELPDAQRAKLSKKQVYTGSDFYDRFLEAKEQADFTSDLQSSDTYWNNRPEERKQYEAQYGDKAREVFDANYAKLEAVWRKKLETNIEKVSLNAKYDWLFGDRPDVDYSEQPIFEASQQIFNGARKIDTMLTDKSVSDREASIAAKTFMNDKGELVTLKDNEKWYSWSKGSGVEMNTNDPKYKSKDGRKITGYEYPEFDAEYRGTPYLKAIYDGDFAKGEIVSMWDTTNVWLLGGNNKKEAGSIFRMLPRTLARTGVNISADIITGTTSLMNSVANWLDTDDSGNAFIDAMNNTATAVKARKLSISEYDQKHTVTTANALDFVAQVVSQLYVGAGLYKGVGKLTKVFLAKNPLITEYNTLLAAGKTAEAGKKIAEFEMKYGFASRQASLVGLTLATGDSVVSEARAAGFNEDEVASIYVAYFGAMLGANTISNRMLEPYFTNATAAPLMNDVIKERLGTWSFAATDKAKFGWAKNLVKGMADKVAHIPSLGKMAAHTPTTLWAKSIMYRGLNEALEEEAEWFGQEVVELGATLVAKKKYKDEDAIPKFDTFMDQGYLGRQWGNILMSGLGGFMGGAMTHVLPGFKHDNEESFIVQGDDKTRLQRIAMVGGRLEASFLKQMDRNFKSGAMGSRELSIQMNDKTGEFYKMTDKEAANSISQAEATKRAIMNQFITYKTLYGSAGKTYDEIKKDYPEYAKDLDAQKDAVLHSELSDLHQLKYDILARLKDPNSVATLEAAATKKVDTKKVTKTEEEEKPEDISKSSGITVEPKDTTEEDKNISQDFTAAVAERAALMGTTNLKDVETLIQTEQKIDDILSGKAAALQVVKSIIRNKKINMFTAEGQKDLLSPGKDSAGKPIVSPFANFGDDLVEKLFTADRNLAKDHAIRHARYLEQSQVVADKLKNITLESIKSLASDARRNPKSIAIDRNTRQLQVLADGVNKLLSKTIGVAEMVEMIESSRKAFGLTYTTEEYNKQLEEQALDGSLSDGTVLSPEEITAFVDTNIELIHKAALSAHLDMLAANPVQFLTARVNLDLKKFKSDLLQSLLQAGNLSLAGDTVDARVTLDKAQKELDKRLDEMETLRAKEVTTNAERFNHQKALDSALKSIDEARSTVSKAKQQAKLEGSFDQVIAQFGADTIESLTHVGAQSELTSVVKISSPDITQAQSLIVDFNVIRNNIAPIVPTTPKMGAVYNLLNELTIKDTALAATINKIIHETDEVDAWTTLASGEVVKSDRPMSIIEQLESMILNPDTDQAEFRNVEAAKILLDTINIRLAQVETIAAVADSLHILQAYSKKHIPTGKNRYDAMPKFMSEYIFDSERYVYLAKKPVRTPEEEEDFFEMQERLSLLVDFDRPDSVHSRLTEAKEKAERLIEMGVKSLDKNERFRIYKNGVANQYNKIKLALSADVKKLGGKNKRLDDAIAKFIGITDKFTESDDKMLVAGKNALDEVLRALYVLPIEMKEDYLRQTQDLQASEPTWAEQSLFISSMATSVDTFNTFYNSVLKEKGNILSPTYEQEQMIRQVFSFIVDEQDMMDSINIPSKLENMIFVNGAAGTGKTTTIGYAIAAAQRFLDANTTDKSKFKNDVLFAAMESHQAETLRKRVLNLGVRKTIDQPMSKRELFNHLEKSNNLDNISIILFDEATFIQGLDPKGAETELSRLHSLLSKLNAGRKANPIKLIGIGDNKQGGWQEGMPTVIDPKGYDAPLDYDNLKERSSMATNGSGVITTDKLTYSFRSLCDKIDETNKTILKISEQVFNSVLGDTTKTTKLVISQGAISNDIPTRARFGGAQFTKDYNNLYTDSKLAENIEKQLNADKDEKIVDEDKIFTVLIVDNNKKSAADLPAGKLKDLASNPLFSKHFKFRTIESVQGGEADYVIADLTKIFPNIPFVSTADQTKLEKAAMVIARARLFARIAVPQDLAIEQADDAIITMLAPEDAAKLTADWTEFYTKQLRGIDADPVVKETQTEKEETSKPEVVEKSETLIPTNQDKQEPLPNIADTSIEVIGKPTVKFAVLPEEIVTLTTDINTTVDEMEPVIEKQQAIIDNTTDEKVKAEAEKVIQDVVANAVESVDVTSIESKLGDDVADALIQEYDGKSDAKSENAFLLDELGYLRMYTNISENPSADAKESGDPQNYMRVQYASDVYGAKKYKHERTYKPKPEAIEAAKEAVKAITALKRGDLSAVNGYSFYLVSFQTHISGTPGTDEVIHQIYAQKGNGLKVPLLMIPYNSINNGPAKTFLGQRKTTIETASEALKFLAKTDSTKGWFSNKLDNFGDSGIAMSDDKISNINKAIAGIDSNTKLAFPTNTEITKIGRVSLSDEDPKFRDPKITVANRTTGLLFMETKLDDIGRIFQAVTAGGPLRHSEKGQFNFSVLPGQDSEYVASLQKKTTRLVKGKPETDYFNNKQTRYVYNTRKDNGDKTSAALLDIWKSDPDSVIKLVNGKPAMKVTSVQNGVATVYTILNFIGANSRIISLYSTGTDNFKIMFGFDEKGVPVGPSDTLESDINEDLEAGALISTLKRNIIELNESNSTELTTDQANVELGNMHGYAVDVVKAQPNLSDKLTLMATKFMAKKQIWFDDLRVFLGDFKQLMEKSGIQLSEPIAWTKTTRGGHQGKAAILYTFHPKSKLDLSNPTTLSRVLNRLAINKATKMTKEEFNAEQFARYGIGVVMLDSKMTNFKELLGRLKGKNVSDINRSSSPVKSAANLRMVNFIKELTLIAHQLQRGPYDITHSRLSKMGLDESGNTISGSEVFDETARKAVAERMAKLDPIVFEKLHKLLTGITADSELGTLSMVSTDDSQEILDILHSDDQAERLELWNKYFSNPTTWSVQDKASIEKYQLSEKNLMQGIVSSKLANGKVSGMVIIDSRTGLPQVVNHRNAISFIPAGTLGVDGTAAVFHMTHFLRQMSKLGTESEVMAVADELDNLMKNYTIKGSLNRGIMWTGRLTTTLDPSLGMSVISKEDADELMTTSVKDISGPSILVSVAELVKDVNRSAPIQAAIQTRPTTVLLSVKKDNFISEIKQKLSDTITNEIVGSMLSDDEIKEIEKEALQNIGREFLANKDLFTSDNYSIIKNEVETEFRDNIKKYKAAPAEKAPVDRVAVDEAKQGATGYEAEIQPEVVVLTALTDIDEAMAQPSPEEREIALTAIKEKVEEAPQVSDDQKKSIVDKINTNITTMNKVQVPAGKSMLDAFNGNLGYINNTTPQHKELTEKFMKEIDNPKTKLILSPEQLAAIPDLIMLLTANQSDLEQLSKTSPSQFLAMETRGLQLQSELYSLAYNETGLNYSMDQMGLLTDAFRSLINPDC